MPNPQDSSLSSDLVAALRMLKRRKLHVSLDVSSSEMRKLNEQFLSQWEPVERLALSLACLPAGLIGFWAEHPRGHILVGCEDRGYIEGEQAVGQRVLDGVAYAALSDIATGSARVLVLAACIIDHLLGSEGAVSGPRLSDGGGISPHWSEVGQRIQELFQLGYGRTEEEKRDVRVYFSHGLADYCLDRRELNVRDPHLERLFGRSILDRDLWCG